MNGQRAADSNHFVARHPRVASRFAIGGISASRYMHRSGIGASTILIVLLAASGVAAPPYQATGLKTGEVTDRSAIVWVRLTAVSEPNPDDAPMVELVYDDVPSNLDRNQKRRRVVGVRYPDGASVADIRHAAPGARGEARLRYRPQNDANWATTSWHAVDEERDFTHQFKIDGLSAATNYELEVQARASNSESITSTTSGRFRTAPSVDDPARVVFTVSTGQAFKDQDLPDGYKIYSQMAKLDPDFFVHTGDIVYYDSLAKTPALARYHWQRTYSRPTNVAFHNIVGSYFIKDDHDTWQNDCWPGMVRDNMFEFTLEQGLDIFREQVPMGPSTYRTYRWGRDLQVWLVEGRDFRSANTDPDGPEKTIWGKEQKKWFKQTFAESDATFRILISPTPLVGPDRTSKADNHSNSVFAHEGRELRRFIADQPNAFVVCGDRHWQYASIHPDSGVREYSCGPASDQHAGGWRQSDFVEEYHRYLNVIGGFLSVTIDHSDDGPAVTFRFHDVDGNVEFEDRQQAD